MVNPYRGEVALTVDGQARVLRLSLGRLVELEEALEADSLVAMVERFEGGRYSARDLVTLLAAGLGVPREALAAADIEGGAVAAAKAAAELLRVTFQVPEPT
ncbi:gene transfer agent family protein [Halovulum sp. GXIMD14794]